MALARVVAADVPGHDRVPDHPGPRARGLALAGAERPPRRARRRQRIAAAGRERLLARFTAQRMTDRLQDMLEDLRPR